MPDYYIYYPKNFEKVKNLEWFVNEGDFVTRGETIFNVEREEGSWNTNVYSGQEFVVTKLHAERYSRVQAGDLLMTVSFDGKNEDLSSFMYRLSLAGPVYAEFDEIPHGYVRKNNTS